MEFKMAARKYLNALLENLHLKFQDFVYGLVEDHGWIWIDIVIDALCNMEVNFRLAKNKEFMYNLKYGDVSAGPGYDSWNTSQIPEDELYCCGCPFHTTSKIAEFFYGDQSHGYCYYLGNGDFSFGHPTDLLWDGCKCCGVRDEIDVEEADEEEISL